MMIKSLKKAFWFPFSSKKQIEKYQKEIRDIEWNAFKKHILKEVKFLDVGCGSGDNLTRAKTEFNCQVIGIDPSPGAHGVGRFSENITNEVQIIQGNAENLPFQNEEFDIVFCSHVLEHVTNQTKSLSEINRVLNKDGVVIIGMPTASMAIISILSHYIFTTHVNILFFIKNIFKQDVLKRFLQIIIPISHSYPNHRFVTYDLLAYRIKQWEKIVKKEFEIQEILTPCLYPYPDFIQWFPKKTLKGISSSVFFICKKKC
jgi:ubiquinone/menaquinone biosynthesis C-methylase UbiE